jgi:hypothetical protein
MTPTRLHLSVPIALAVGALVVAAAGSATAVTSHRSNGDKLIAAHSLSGNRLHHNTVTGAQIKESTLGLVPRAAAAKTVGGYAVKKIFFTGKPDAAAHTIFNADGFSLQAGCSGTAPTLKWTIGAGELHGTGEGDPTPYDIDQSSAGQGDLLDGHVEGELSVSYATATGHVITLDLAFDRASTFGGQNLCTVYGTAFID